MTSEGPTAVVGLSVLTAVAERSMGAVAVDTSPRLFVFKLLSVKDKQVQPVLQHGRRVEVQLWKSSCV